MENFKDIELNEKQIKAIKYIGNSRQFLTVINK